MKQMSTAEVAKVIGVHKRTLLVWLYEGKIKEPKRIKLGGLDARLWTPRDVTTAAKYKSENYRKGRGRKRIEK